MGGHDKHGGFHGPKCWITTAIAGLILGVVLSFVAPANYSEPHAPGTDHNTTAQESENHNQADQLHDDSQQNDSDLVDSHDNNGQSDATEQLHEQSEHFAQQDLPAPLTMAAAQDDELGTLVPDQEQPTDTPPITNAHDQATADHNAGIGGESHGPAPVIPIWLIIPFALLLLSIAVMPFINEEFWHHHYPDFAFLLGGMIIAYYIIAYGKPGYLPTESYGLHKMRHTFLEYYSFIALIGGLFVASGGVHVDVRGKGGPLINTLLLGIGAVVANIMGTTGASVLLIRPFMRINKGRLQPIHVVMFIFIISNCGGALTPIGDPPLYLGYLKGIPFFWTLEHLWIPWSACIGMLLGIFFIADTLVSKKHPFTPNPDEPVQKAGLRISGTTGIIALVLIIAGVFLDPFLKKHFGIEGYPIGATFQILVATAAYLVADREIHKTNDFNFEPVKEVALLFIGIFATMTPALGFLAMHGQSLGLDSPTAFYFGTGSLSGVLDNAPTYLNFLQVSFGPTEINSESVHAYLAVPLYRHELIAISLGAVFFGAMTYIGNGPNFMVRAIAESSGLKMPSFFGYMLRSVFILLPVLVAVWAIFIR